MSSTLIQGDCLKIMPMLPPGCIDMVLTDPPYGTTDCKWDSVIPLDDMWAQLNRLVKKTHVTALCGAEPFSSKLRISNLADFKYDWIWYKTKGLGFAHAKNRPMSTHEIVSIFSKNAIKHLGQNCRMPYNPQGLQPFGKLVNGDKSCKGDRSGHRFARPSNKIYTREFSNYPRTVIEFPSTGSPVHPTQKPVALMEYLIKTYTNPGETVLDFTTGSGTTGVACRNTGRSFVGIELDSKYFQIAKGRIG